MTLHLNGRDQVVVLTGREIDWFRAKAIAIGLETWAKHRIKVNRAYTPKAMMAQAQRLTGKTFPPTDYIGAAKAIRALVDAEVQRAKEHAAIVTAFGQPL